MSDYTDADVVFRKSILAASAKSTLCEIIQDEDDFAEVLTAAKASKLRNLTIVIECIAEIRNELIEIFNPGDEDDD